MGTPVARLSVLRAAIARDTDQSNRLAHAATLDLLDRASRADDRTLPGWERFPEAASELLGETGWPMTVAVLANLVAVADFAQPADFVTLSRLAKRYGNQPVASVQSTADVRLRTSSGMPLATRLAWQVARTAEVVESLVANRMDEEKASQVAGTCRRSGIWLVAADVDPDTPGPELSTVEDALGCADHGGITAWRGQAAIVAANPWAPYPAELHHLLVDAGRPELADLFEGVIEHYRTLSEQRDRGLVAREVRRLVALSGLSQRQFAALCGTSAPRLSTYVNGLVTPSAAMMVRFNRVSERAQRQERRARDSSA